MVLYLFPLLLGFLFGVYSPTSFVLVLCCCLVFLWASQHSFVNSSSLLSVLSFLLWVLSLVFFSTSSLFCLYLCFEVSLFPLVLVLLFFGYQPENLCSSTYFIIYTVLGGLPLLYYVSLSYYCSIHNLAFTSEFCLLIISLAFFIKSPLYFFHAWLPKAHVESPIFGSIILAGVMLKFGGYGILLLSPSFGVITIFYLFVTLVGGIVCSIVCLRHWDLKAIVAYSSIIHIGSVSIGALSCSEAGRWAAVAIMVSHSLVSPLLFAFCYDLYLSTSSRSVFSNSFSALSSVIVFFLALGFGINMGTPPFLSFWIEVSLFICLSSFFVCGLPCLIFVCFLVFGFCIFFYLACFSRCSSQFLCSIWSPLCYIPGLSFSFLITFSTSLF